MTQEQEEQRRIDLWKLFQILSPLISIIAFIIYMQADISKTVQDIEMLKTHSESVNKVLTAHSTQIAVNSSQISFNKSNTIKLEATLLRLEDKIDMLIKGQSQAR